MATKKTEAAGTVKARVLLDCSFGAANSVVQVPAEVAEQAAGQLDANPDAVAYAEQLAAEAPAS